MNYLQTPSYEPLHDNTLVRVVVPHPQVHGLEGMIVAREVAFIEEEICWHWMYKIHFDESADHRAAELNDSIARFAHNTVEPVLEPMNYFLIGRSPYA